jgi:dTDP-4-amino-4,6-dideoxygalactose transaminase
MPMPHQPCFAHLPSARQPFPNAQALYDRALMLPCYPTLSDEAAAYVCAQIRAYCEQGAADYDRSSEAARGPRRPGELRR